MQIHSSGKSFDRKGIEKILKHENTFITELLSILPFPTHKPADEDALLQDTSHTEEKPNLKNKETSRAQSLVELQQRIHMMTNKKGLSYKEKLLKKNLKAKLRKNNKKNKMSKVKKDSHTTGTQLKQESAAEEHKLEVKSDALPQAGKLEFSKIDFSNIGKKKRKEKQDPHKLLKDIQEQKTKLEELRKSGELEQARIIKDKQAWKSAIARVRGEKVKDDEQLLTKSIKKDLQKRKQSKKKWEARMETVKKTQADKQKKRQDNIDKRKRSNKINKMKKAVKRGKVIPGF